MIHVKLSYYCVHYICESSVGSIHIYVEVTYLCMGFTALKYNGRITSQSSIVQHVHVPYIFPVKPIKTENPYKGDL